MKTSICWFNDISLQDIDQVGGKNASLGEMISHLSPLGIQVPHGFATTAQAFRAFLTENQLSDKIYQQLKDLNPEDIHALRQAGTTIREAILQAPFSASFEQSIREAYQTLSNGADISVAVRSSATAEDLPGASFAGQQETYLNIVGCDQLLVTIKKVFASLFTDRAIAYRIHQNFLHEEVALSVGVQKMVRSDLATSGVMFTLDTESGFNDVVFITAAYGLGELVVQGSVNPDEFYLYKPAVREKRSAILRRHLGSKQQKMVWQAPPAASPVAVLPVSEAEQQRFTLTDAELVDLAEQALIIEKHYGTPMDIEWAKDGIDQKIYIVQARPETVKSQTSQLAIHRFQLKEKSAVLAEGRSIGQRIGQGHAKLLKTHLDIHLIEPGDVLVTDMTDPDWEPIMKRASAIVTNRGGRTCHAAIIARELGIPAVVGCGDATQTIPNNAPVTVSCAEGDTGLVYSGLLPIENQSIPIDKMPSIPFKIMMNVGDPHLAFDFQRLPNDGVGLARLEFVINRQIGIHPNALLDYEKLDPALQKEIAPRIAAYANPIEFYIERLKEGIATIAAAFYPKPVIVRLSDFKSNEYAHLLGGHLYEPQEENPMIGFRGASRYVSTQFEPCFAMECEAFKRARHEMGLTNIELMIPFVRTVEEDKQVIALLEKYGLKRGEKGLRVIMMCEIPSNALLADEFLTVFDGFSIGSNDLTQLTLGLDRDSALVASLFDERNAAVKKLLSMAIQACKKHKKYIGICGQGPSDHPDFAKWLIDEGIDSVSLNPDSVLNTWLFLANTKN